MEPSHQTTAIKTIELAAPAIIRMRFRTVGFKVTVVLQRDGSHLKRYYYYGKFYRKRVGFTNGSSDQGRGDFAIAYFYLEPLTFLVVLASLSTFGGAGLLKSEYDILQTEEPVPENAVGLQQLSWKFSNKFL